MLKVTFHDRFKAFQSHVFPCFLRRNSKLPWNAFFLWYRSVSFHWILLIVIVMTFFHHDRLSPTAHQKCVINSHPSKIGIHCGFTGMMVRIGVTIPKWPGFLRSVNYCSSSGYIIHNVGYRLVWGGPPPPPPNKFWIQNSVK